MKVVIKDVAREAHVSVATVSRVVNDVSVVNEETRQRVLDAIEKTGYKPNQVARSLKKQKTNTLGIMIPDISDPQYTDIVRGAEDTTKMYNYNIILMNTDLSLEKEKESLDVLIEKQCDGIIYIGKDLSPEIKEQLKRANCEIVLGCVEDRDGELISVLTDNEDAAYNLTKKLIEDGHKNIAIIADIVEGQIDEDKIKGIKRAAEEMGITIDEDLIKRGKIDLKGSAKLANQIFDTGKDVDLIICMNDQVALSALRVAEERGLKVPDDVSITGFNDYWISEWLKPTLTTVKQNMFQIGLTAARMLIKKIEKKEDLEANKTELVPYEIVYRDSTK